MELREGLRGSSRKGNKIPHKIPLANGNSCAIQGENEDFNHKPMNDSADMKQASLKDAANALQSALSALETSLDPMLGRLALLETKAREAEGFSEDRSRLAGELDEALENRRVREAEFEALSKQTRAELDMTIHALKDALAGGGDG